MRQAEFAGDQAIVRDLELQLAAGGEERQGDRQIVQCSFFAKGARSEIHRCPRPQGGKAAVGEGGVDAVRRLLDGGIGQAEQDQPGFAALIRIDLDLHRHGVDPNKCHGGERGQHGLL